MPSMGVESVYPVSMEEPGMRCRRCHHWLPLPMTRFHYIQRLCNWRCLMGERIERTFLSAVDEPTTLIADWRALCYAPIQRLKGRETFMIAEAGQTHAAPDAQGKYVYCIIQSKEPRSFGLIGIGGRGDNVYTVRHRDLAAVVSDTPLIVYDPTRDNVLAHEQVNETVLRQFTVLPLA